ncbi:MAG TPA: DUF3108 domain-containing protein [Nevskiaceae bacterium]|nr:DUF3108 domain-containing protein [Nevskiaceae bacterium]
MTQPVLPSFDDRFSVKWNGISAGDMQVRLQAQAGQPGCYVDRATTDPNVLAKAIYGAPQQTSVFCVVDGHIQTHTYRYEVPGRSQDSYSLSFDWKHHTVTDGHGKVRTIPDDAIDSLALQQAVRLWLLKHAKDAKPPEAHFTLVDDHHLTHYRFKLAGRHIVDTPAGRFDAWLMERVDNPDKVGKYWIAPARNYLPVASETRNSSAAVLTTMLEP